MPIFVGTQNSASGTLHVTRKKQWIKVYAKPSFCENLLVDQINFMTSSIVYHSSVHIMYVIAFTHIDCPVIQISFVWTIPTHYKSPVKQSSVLSIVKHQQPEVVIAWCFMLLGLSFPYESLNIALWRLFKTPELTREIVSRNVFTLSWTSLTFANELSCLWTCLSVCFHGPDVCCGFLHVFAHTMC